MTLLYQRKSKNKKETGNNFCYKNTCNYPGKKQQRLSIGALLHRLT